MKVTYNLKDRKPFVKVLEEITGMNAVYKKTLTFNDMADSEEIERILTAKSCSAI